MPHVQVTRVMDRTDYNRPITNPTKQDIHREQITESQSKRAKKKKSALERQRESESVQESWTHGKHRDSWPSTDTKREKREQKRLDKQHQKSNSRARDAKHERIHTPYNDQVQESDHAEEYDDYQAEHDNLTKQIREKEETQAQYDQLEKEIREKQEELRAEYDQLQKEPKPYPPTAHVPAPPDNTQKKYTRPQEHIHRGEARPQRQGQTRFEGQKDLGHKDDGRGVGPPNPHPRPPHGNGQEDDGMGLRGIYCAPKYRNSKTQNGAVDRYGSTAPRKMKTLYYNKYIA